MFQAVSHAAAHELAAGVMWCAVGCFDLADSRVPTLGAGIGDSATVSERSMVDAANTAFSAARQRHDSHTFQRLQERPSCSCSVPSLSPVMLRRGRHPFSYSNSGHVAPAGLRLTGAALTAGTGAAPAALPVPALAAALACAACYYEPGQIVLHPDHAAGGASSSSIASTQLATDIVPWAKRRAGS